MTFKLKFNPRGSKPVQSFAYWSLCNPIVLTKSFMIPMYPILKGNYKMGPILTDRKRSFVNLAWNFKKTFKSILSPLYLTKHAQLFKIQNYSIEKLVVGVQSHY